ncbi:MAG TPA: MiaB/RimO family radical SAM methylthiotransferase [Gaiellales bacterium]|nr:MiaB/RimO family radical SAM methylthiotransferase [Gaiellales bacterium]
MSGFAAEFLGCKVSMTDAQEIRERLVAAGHAEVDPGRAALRIVNTCCVTAEAVAKSRKAVRRAARTAERVVVTGCGANLRGAAFEDVAENVTVVRGAPEAVPRIVAGWVGDLGCAGPQPAFPRTRAYVKIQDGCSFTCSYCVIPQVRGRSRSRRGADVLADVVRRARQGHREVVLTGINLGCFRDRAAGMRLADLLAAVAQVEGIDRVRLSSIEVNHVSDALLAAMGRPGVARHLHVPMQSGDDGVLEAMRRRYTARAFLRAMRRARERVGGVNLTTDVIVGHPAEDDAAFEHTLDAVREAGFTRVHVFPYSPRPGTADEASDPVPAAVKAERSRRLRDLAERQARAHRRALRGTRQLVLVETEAGRGYADDYTPFVVPGGRPGTMVEVEL